MKHSRRHRYRTRSRGPKGVLLLLTAGAVVGGLWFLGRTLAPPAPVHPIAWSPLDSDHAPLNLLRDPPLEGEGWLAGEVLARALLGAGPASAPNHKIEGSMLLVAFVSCDESSTFFVADAMNLALSNLPGAAGALTVAVPRPSSQGHRSAESCRDSDLEDSLIGTPVFDDSSFRLWRAFGARSWPSVHLVDRGTGRMLQQWSGRDFVHRWSWDRRIEYSGSGQRNRTNVNAGTGANIGPKASALPTFLPLTGLEKRLVSQPHLVADVAYQGPDVYVADAAAHQIVRVLPEGQTVPVLGGSSAGFKDGMGEQAQLRFPHRIVAGSPRGRMFIADWGNRALRLFDLRTQSLSTVALPPDVVPQDILLAGDTLVVTQLLEPKLWTAVLDDRLEEPESEDVESPTASVVLAFTSTQLPADFGPGTVLSLSSSNEVLLTSVRTGSRLALDIKSGEKNPILALDAPVKGRSLRNTATLARSSASGEINLWLSERAKDSAGIIVQNHDASRSNALALEGMLLEDGSQLSPEGLSNGPEDTPHGGASDTVLTWTNHPQALCLLKVLGDVADPLGPALRGHARCSKLLFGSRGDPSSAQESAAVPALVLKAGTVSRLSLTFRPPQSFAFSERDLHLLRTPDGAVLAWNPRGEEAFDYRAPQAPGPARFDFFGTVCDRKNTNDCQAVKETIAVEVRSSFHESQAKANIQLRL